MHSSSLGCPKIFPLSAPVLYWLSHLTCISSLKAKNERKTFIFTQLKISRYNQHFFAIFRTILRNWPPTYTSDLFTTVWPVTTGSGSEFQGWQLSPQSFFFFFFSLQQVICAVSFFTFQLRPLGLKFLVLVYQTSNHSVYIPCKYLQHSIMSRQSPSSPVAWCLEPWRQFWRLLIFCCVASHLPVFYGPCLKVV